MGRLLLRRTEGDNGIGALIPTKGRPCALHSQAGSLPWEGRTEVCDLCWELLCVDIHLLALSMTEVC